MSKVKIKELFHGLQQQMLAQLSTNSDFIHHPTSKGDSFENCFIEWLEKYLPNRYKVSKAIMIDSDGNLSDQIDVVIYDSLYSPLIFHQNGITYIPAESVYAVFEVKPEIDKGYIEYAAGKIESVRKLLRHTTKEVRANTGDVPNIKAPKYILGGILAIKSSWNPVYGKSFERAIKSQKGNRQIDIGCGIESGGFTVDHNGKIVTIKYSDPDESLVFFFLRLYQKLQHTATVAPMDITKYEQYLNYYK